MDQKSRARSVFGLIATLALCVSPAAARAQHESAGNGFLFEKPQGTITLRLGYDLANAGSDVYAVQRRDLTIGPRGFDGLSWGADLALDASRRFEIGFTADGNTRTHLSEYRAWEDNNNQPITQRTTLSVAGGSMNVHFNFYDRGRSVSNFAWIPAEYLPYIGLGGGFLYYELDQKGDFIDFGSPNKDVVNDQLHSDGWGALGQAFAGLQRNLTPHVALTTEARYTVSNPKLNQDYSELGRISLSGLALTVGTTIRF